MVYERQPDIFVKSGDERFFYGVQSSLNLKVSFKNYVYAACVCDLFGDAMNINWRPIRGKVKILLYSGHKVMVKFISLYSD